MTKIKYFRFGAFRLYPTEHLLLREEAAVPLAPKAFDILLYLVQNSGHLVKRDVLMEAIWPDSFVEETNLTVNISLLRKALETGDQPYIETIPRKGYRFTAEVTECEEDGEKYQKSNEDVMSPSVGDPASAAAVAMSPSVGAQPADAVAAGSATVPAAAVREVSVTPAPWRTSASRILVITIVLIALAIGLFYLGSHWKSHAPTVSAAERSIAVLPFRPLVTNAEDEYLGMGLTDALITRLGTVHRIIVRPVGAVRKYAKADDPIAAGRQLAVQSVLEGSIQREPAEDKIRVTVRLLRVSDGEVLWATKFDQKFTDMFSVEDSISQAVADRLTVNLTGEEQKQLLRPFTGNSDAYQLYLKGRYFWNKRTVDGVKKSIDYFQRAIQADPNYALAYAGLADSYAMAGSYGYSILPPQQAMPLAEAAAAKALAIDDSLAEVHASLGYIKFTYDWDWAGAEQEFKRAIALNPLYDTAHHWYSHELIALGRNNEAMAEARRALELSPSDTVMNEHLGWTYLMMRDYDNAIRNAQKAIELDPDFLLAHRVLGMAYQYKGQHDLAIAEFQRGIELTKGDPVAKAFLARSYAAAGKTAEATQILNELLQQAKTQYVPPAEIGETFAALGRKDEAFEWLNKACDERAAAVVYLKVAQVYDPLRSDARFEGLLKRVHLG
ncbi:MAG: winged helix-turn-helix domain-containing protein [Candidatus Korobacteraceae bacterium]|jgi:DNA-binding winged helix-turn-helix (wHTH) protein/TolB-like protein/Tfp pilus assembly protein PilF